MSDWTEKFELPIAGTNQQARAKLFQLRCMWGSKCGERGEVPESVWTCRNIDEEPTVEWKKMSGKGDEAVYERVTPKGCQPPGR